MVKRLERSFLSTVHLPFMTRYISDVFVAFEIHLLESGLEVCRDSVELFWFRAEHRTNFGSKCCIFSECNEINRQRGRSQDISSITSVLQLYLNAVMLEPSSFVILKGIETKLSSWVLSRDIPRKHEQYFLCSYSQTYCTHLSSLYLPPLSSIFPPLLHTRYTPLIFPPKGKHCQQQ